jgi:hypothetical protein
LTETPWTYVITPPARRDLRRLDRPIKQRAVDALDHFVATLKPATPASWLTATNGDYALVAGACASISTTKPA